MDEQSSLGFCSDSANKNKKGHDSNSRSCCLSCPNSKVLVLTMKRWMQALFRLAILHLRQRVRRLNYVRYIEKYLIIERMFVYRHYSNITIKYQ